MMRLIDSRYRDLGRAQDGIHTLQTDAGARKARSGPEGSARRADASDGLQANRSEAILASPADRRSLRNPRRSPRALQNTSVVSVVSGDRGSLVASCCLLHPPPRSGPLRVLPGLSNSIENFVPRVLRGCPLWAYLTCTLVQRLDESELGVRVMEG
jgi:hypothetical protein